MKNLVILALVVFLLTLIFEPEPAQDYNMLYGQEVILYATEWCGYCQKMRQLFAKQEIQYLEFDIESSAVAHKEFKALGGQGVPLTLVKGTTVHGYNPKKVMSLLQK